MSYLGGHRMNTMQKFSILFVVSITAPSFAMKPSQKGKDKSESSSSYVKSSTSSGVHPTASTTSKSNPKKPINLKPLHSPEVSGAQKKSKSKHDYTINFTDELIEEMEEVAENAPIDAKNIIEHLKNRNFLRDGYYRYATFVGIPGSGKTTYSKFIAYTLSKLGWNHRFISSGELLEDTRNRTLVRLRKMLHDLIDNGTPLIFIIDEFNELLENTENTHFDTSATAKFLWPFLDAQHHNHNFFFIGAMNRDSKLPHAFKNRIYLRRIKFHPFVDPTTKINAFRKKFDKYLQLTNDIDDAYLDTQLKKLGECGGRDLREFASLLRRIFRRYDQKSDVMLINKKYFEEGVKEYIENRTDTEHDQPEETEIIIRERHYVQNKLKELFNQLSFDRSNGGSPYSSRNKIIDMIDSGTMHTIYDLVGDNSPSEICRKMTTETLMFFTDEQTKIAEELVKNIITKRTRVRAMFSPKKDNNEGCIIV